MAPQPRKKLQKTASTASKMASRTSLMIPLNSWRNSDLFKKKGSSVALKTPELASFGQKKSMDFFLGAPWGKGYNFSEKVAYNYLGFLGKIKKFIFWTLRI